MLEDVLSDRLDELGLSPAALSGVMGEMRHVPRAAAWMDRMWQASEFGGPAANLDVDAAFLALLSELLRACGDERLLTPPPSIGDRRVARVIDYVEAFIDQPLAVGELAEIAHVSVFYFGRVFKRAVGDTPHRYVMGRRVERAKDLLARGDHSLAAIAFACGFASQSHMTDCFRAQIGTTPGQFRAEVSG